MASQDFCVHWNSGNAHIDIIECPNCFTTLYYLCNTFKLHLSVNTNALTCLVHVVLKSYEYWRLVTFMFVGLVYKVLELHTRIYILTAIVYAACHACPTFMWFFNRYENSACLASPNILPFCDVHL